MKKVIVFRTNLLARSETFIKEQARTLVRWEPTLVGYHAESEGLNLGDLNAKIIPGLSCGLWQRAKLRTCQHLGISHAQTVNLLSELRATLIHVHFGTDAVDIWPSVHRLKLPMLVTLHGYDINIHKEWWESGKAGRRRKEYPKRLLALAMQPLVRFIAVSKAIREEAVKLGIPEEKIEVCYTGVDTDIFRPGPQPISKRKRRVLFVGRLVEKKGVIHLIEAFSIAQNAFPDAELVIAGDGPLRLPLEQEARDAQIQAVFLGAVSSEEVRLQMDQAQLLCLPSISAENGDAEGFGMVILEAQASALPVITSARGGAAEGILNGKTGFLFKEKDSEALAGHIIEIFSNKHILDKMSASARDFVCQRFDLRKCTRNLEDIYSEQHV